MSKKVTVGIIISVALNLLVKAIWILGIELEVQRTMGNEAYGAYYSLFSFSALFLILLDLGITNYNTRNIAQHEYLLKKHLSGLFVLKLLLGVVYALVMLPVAYFLGFREDMFYGLTGLALTQFFNSMTLYFRSNLSATFRFKGDAFFSIADRLLLIIFCGILLSGYFHSQMNLQLFIGVQLFTSFITVLMAGILNLWISGKLNFNWNIPFYISIIRQSLPFALLFLFMSIYTRIDAVLLYQWLPEGNRASGIYAAGYRLFDAYAQLVIITSGVLLPFFASHIRQPLNAMGLLQTMMKIFITLSVTLSVGSYFYCELLAEKLYEENVYELAHLFQVFLSVSVPYVVSILGGTYLTAMGKLKELNIIAVSAVMINLSCNAFLIPVLEAKGAALSAIFTHSFSALMMAYFIFPFLNMSNAKKDISAIFLFGLIMIITGWVLKSLNIETYVSIIVFAILSSVSAWFLKLINFGVFKRLLNKLS